MLADTPPRIWDAVANSDRDSEVNQNQLMRVLKRLLLASKTPVAILLMLRDLQPTSLTADGKTQRVLWGKMMGERGR